jgi:hypothetical protein
MIRIVVALLVVFAPATAAAESLLFLNRCSGGCTVTGGPDDARAMSSTIPCAGGANCGGGSCFCAGGPSGSHQIEEFENSAGLTGAAADAEWNAIVQCMREVYSPYGVTITDVKPTAALTYTQGIIAGRPQNIGYPAGSIGGIASNGLGCGAADNVISFTFANIYGGASQAFIWRVCATAAQETAHSFGLEHVFEFGDGRSTCTDPMTYRGDCGGQKFFRNDPARCGEASSRPCACGGLQNSHAKLLSLLGPGMATTGVPALTVSSPTAGETVGNGATVVATASAKRGVSRLELWLNGYKWLTVKGAPFGQMGQPESTYPLTFPAAVPNSVIDIVVKAYDDIEAETIAPTIRVTKGAPCASDATCAAGQKCDGEGRCFWEPPVGQVGDACTYPQFCISEQCITASDGMYCSQSCVVGVADSCPSGFECEGMAGQTGVCVTASAGTDTCCGIGANGKASALISVLVVGLVLRRRRRG